MEFIADFHIHSKYSRATSKDMDLDHLSYWAKIKGIDLLGTGDFTHPLWIEHLKSKLKPSGKGLYSYDGVHYMLTAEISSIYSKNNKVYRIHNLVFAPSFDTAEKINTVLSGIGNLRSDGRPILGLDAEELAKIVFDIDENCMLVPAHVWTPWFSLFGSKSGFDLLEDCFGRQSKKIYCLETGLSSDPAMNWRLSKLDRYSLISNSDCHSPSKIGREANVFNCELSYYEIIDVLKKKDKKRFLYTIEFFPEEGKYHFDGHRNCKVRFSPQETKEHKNICPVCEKPLTVGVMNRVDALADRRGGTIPKNAVPFKNLIPLVEIIAEVRGVSPTSKKAGAEYHQIISRFGTEFNVLLKSSEAQLYENMAQPVAKAVVKMRKGEIEVTPGYDGEYGIISITKGKEGGLTEEKQLSFF